MTRKAATWKPDRLVVCDVHKALRGNIVYILPSILTTGIGVCTITRSLWKSAIDSRSETSEINKCSGSVIGSSYALSIPLHCQILPLDESVGGTNTARGYLQKREMYI